jgi:restriction endonuclease S subunit
MVDNWQLFPLSELASFSRGISWRKDEESQNAEGVAVLSIPNVGRGRLDFDVKHRLKKIPNASKLLAVGDVLFVGSSGSIDNIARCAPVTSLPAQPVAFASFTFKATPRLTVCDAAFFYFLMNSSLPAFANFARRASDGKFNFQLTSFVEHSAFRIPSLDEQRQIAAVLSAVQRAIERQDRLIALTAELKKALMHKLFTEGTRGEPLKQTEIGPVPESWKLARLRDLLSIKHGFAFDGAYFRAQGERILMTPGHFDENGGFRDQGERTKYYIGEVPSGYTLSPNDLLVAMTEQKSGLLGSAALVPAGGTYLHNQRLGLVTALDESRLSKGFLYFFFNRPEVKSQVASTATGSKVRHTSPGKILNLHIALPSMSEQRLISEAIQKVVMKRNVHLALSKNLAGLFKTLLHQLMTAQIRVHDLDLAALEETGQDPAGAA